MDVRIIQTYRSDIGDEQIRLMRIAPENDQLHRHAFFELVYVIRGSATHYLGTEAMPLREGDYFIIDTGSVHCYQNTNDFQIVNCLFLPQYVDRALVNCPSLSALLSNQILRFVVPVDICTADRVCHDNDGTVLHLIEAMEAEYKTKQTGYMELLRCHLTEILVYAVRASDMAEKKRPPHEATAAMAEYLRRHYAQPMSLEDMSRSLGYTPQYLSGLSRRDTGMTLQEYLQRLRVEEACRLMNEKKLRLAEIAQAVGYSDSKHFAQVFRRWKGISPKELQKAIQK